MRWLAWIMLYGLLAGCSSTPVMPMNYASNEADISGDAIARSVQLELEVEELPSAIQRVQDWVEAADGFVQSQSHYSQSSVRVICRIPSNQHETFTRQVKTLGELKNEALQADELSDDVVSRGAELNNLYKLRDRLNALLARADKVDDVLAIERELNRIQTRIDALEKMEHQQQKRIQYTSYTLTLNQKASATVLGPLGWVAYGTWWTVKKLFVIR